MANTYVTNEWDELDLICFNYYGYSNGSLEAVLEANRDLARLMPRLPAGIEIVLPDLTPPASTTVLQIWG